VSRLHRILATLILGLALMSSCAYYNTFYSARKYYDRATAGQPYVFDRTDQMNNGDFTRSLNYSKKLITEYPKSKWVDDAYLLWARALIGQNDPIQTIKMLVDFPDRFPKSSLRPDAEFYLGVACRQAHKYRNAERVLNEFIAKSPKHKLVPYAYLELSRTLNALQEPDSAAQAASKVIEKFPKSVLAVRARVARADAWFDAKRYEPARHDYHELGKRSSTDDDRLKYLLREVDCLEAAHSYDEALALLRDAISHVREPVLADTTGGRVATVQATPGYDRYGRLLVRIGSVHGRAGRKDEALAAYQRVVQDYPHDALAGEAQYRIGYTYETLGDDFDRARVEYGRVKDQVGQVGFGMQAADRLKSLDRLAQFRGSAGDTAEKKIEAEFLLAEQYLFELDNPERALAQYQKIQETYAGTPQAAKAMNAQAWVLSRKLHRDAEADSIFWEVVHNHPATEAQLAARDYLEFAGKEVPTDLIKLPERQLAAADTTLRLTEPPDSVPPLGTPTAGSVDSLGRLVPQPPSLSPSLSPGPEGTPGMLGDAPEFHGGSGTPRHGVGAAAATGSAAAARRDTTARGVSAPRDSAAAHAKAPQPLPSAPAATDSTGGDP